MITSQINYRCRLLFALLVGVCATWLTGVAAESISFEDFRKMDNQQFQEWKAAQSGKPTAKAEATADRARAGIVYSGKAEADHRPASLSLHFKGKTVSGRLKAQGSDGPNVYLPSTDVAFGPAMLVGKWEDKMTTIQAAWTGGDYMKGALMPGYPTSGNLDIGLMERDGKMWVRLDRNVGSAYGYIFPAKGGVVYTPPGLGALDPVPDEDDPEEEPPETEGPSAYWDPVGKWAGSTTVEYGGTVYSTSYRATLTKDGRATGNVTDNGENTPFVGTWCRVGSAVQVTWSKASLENAGVDDAEPVMATFDGPNCLKADTPYGDIKLFRSQSLSPSTPPLPNIDITKVTGITLSPSAMTVVPGTNYPLPRIFATLRDSDDLVELPNPEATWTGGMHVTPEGDSLKVHKNARPNTKVTLRVSVDVGNRLRLAKCEVSIVKELQVGYCKGAVRLNYNPRAPDGSGWPKSPVSSQVRLTGNDENRLITVGPDGNYRFENLAKGRYDLKLVSVKLPKLPEGYAPSSSQAWTHYWFDIPMVHHDVGDVWHANTHLEWTVRLPKDVSHCVHGVVTHKGKPIKDITVTLVGRDGASKRTGTTDSGGFYRIDTDKMTGGPHVLTALKMVGENPLWATDGDLMDIASNRDGETPPTVGVPAGAAGVEVNIPCLTRKELFD